MFYILIGIPVLTGLFGIIYALKSTNSKVFPLLGLSIAFLVIEILMTLLGKFTLISRYTLLSFMIIILVSAYGITEIKSQKIRNFLIYSLIIVNLFFLIASPNSAPKIERSEGFKPVAATLHQYNLGKDDIIFMLYGGKILDKYFNNSQMLDFQLFDLYPIGSVSKLHYLVGTDLEKSINQGNASEKLKYYITSPTSSEYFQKYLEDNCFKKLKKGRYFAFVVTKGLYLYDGNTLEILSTNDNEYKKQPLLLMIYSKIAKDTNNESLANLKPVSIVDNGVWVIYIYQKD